MTVEDILKLAKAYRRMGDAIGEQLDSFVEMPSEETLAMQNGNAVREFTGWIRKVRQEAEWADQEDLMDDAAQLLEIIKRWES